MAKANYQILLNSFAMSHLCRVLECRNLVCHVAQQEPLGCDSQKKKKISKKDFFLTGTTFASVALKACLVMNHCALTLWLCIMCKVCGCTELSPKVSSALTQLDCLKLIQRVHTCIWILIFYFII